MTIRQEIERRIGRAVSIGQIYSALNRLENKGFISSMVKRSHTGSRRTRQTILQG